MYAEVRPNIGANLYFTSVSTPAYQTVRDYQYDVSLDGGATIWGSFSSGQTVTPLTGVICPGNPCSFRIRAAFDATVSASSAWKTPATIAAPTLNSAKYANGGANLYFTRPAVATYQTVRDYQYDVSLDGGATVWGSFSSGQTTTPLTGVTCPGNPCTYRIRAVFDSTLSASSAWKSAT